MCIIYPIKNEENIYYLKLDWRVWEDMQEWRVLTPQGADRFVARDVCLYVWEEFNWSIHLGQM